MEEIRYYTDEYNSEFSGVTKPSIEIPPDFPFLHHNLLWRITSAVLYRGIMTPFAFLYCKLRFSLKIVNRKILRPYRKKGSFLYSNHTLLAGDAFIPSLVNFPKRVYVVVNADNIATPGTKNFVLMNGAIPIPSSLTGMKNFLNALEKRILQNACVQVYPEAHIWPYYTGIRPFSPVSFRYPVKLNAPSFCTTTTFQKKRFGKTPRVTVYVDGPFFPDTSLPQKKQEQALRNELYETMLQRSQNSSYSPIQYRKKEETA